MKKLSETLKEMGIDFTFPIQIKNSKGRLTYFESSNGFWIKSEYDSNDKLTYYEDSNGFWTKYEYGSNGNETYYEDSHGFWTKYEYDSKGRETYSEDRSGHKKGTSRSSTCEGKVVEVDGVKYKLQTL